jgi:hypothetical protein
MSEKVYKDFTLMVDWRIKATPWVNTRVPIILPTGLHKLDENGKEITTLFLIPIPEFFTACRAVTRPISGAGLSVPVKFMVTG